MGNTESHGKSHHHQGGHQHTPDSGHKSLPVGAGAVGSANAYTSPTGRVNQLMSGDHHTPRSRKTSANYDGKDSASKPGVSSPPPPELGEEPTTPSKEYSSARRKSVELGKDILAMAKSPHIPSKFKKQSMDFGHMLLPGRRSRRPSTDAGPINIILESSVVEEKLPKVPVIPLEQIYDPKRSVPFPEPRVRATTIGGHHSANKIRTAAAEAAKRRKLAQGNASSNKPIPTVFRYTQGRHLSRHSSSDSDSFENRVFIAGTMTQWKAKEMSRPEGENDFILILDAPEGDIYYKFFVDAAWKHDSNQPSVTRSCDNNAADDKASTSRPSSPPSSASSSSSSRAAAAWNVLSVRKSDNDVFDALACDSFALKDSRHLTGQINDDDREHENPWSQEKPTDLYQTGGQHKDGKAGSGSSSQKGPPILPPHLLQILLNKELLETYDPVLLPEPSHVSLHHLYAQSIRDDMLVLSSTARYRKKCVTVLLYKPLDPVKK